MGWVGVYLSWSWEAGTRPGIISHIVGGIPRGHSRANFLVFLSVWKKSVGGGGGGGGSGFSRRNYAELFLSI